MGVKPDRASVFIHVQSKLSADEAARLIEGLERLDGILAVNVDPAQSHLLIISYNPEFA